MLRHDQSDLDCHVKNTIQKKRRMIINQLLPQMPNTPREMALNLELYWHHALNSVPGAIDVIDMFCGCGGMSVGFKSVNGSLPTYHLVGSVDIDNVSMRTYELNLGFKPHAINIKDLAHSKVLLNKTISEMRSDPQKPLILIGCAPCQGFSSHRNDNGTRDPRNSLFFDFGKIAVELCPEAIVIENVPELLTDRYWPLISNTRILLEKAGYYVNIGIHNMAEYGVPQERFRVLMLAMRHPFHPPVGFLERSDFRTVRDAIGSLPSILAGERHPSDPMHYTAGHKESTLATIRAVPKDGGCRPENVGPECLRRAKVRHGKAVYEDVYGRLFWDKPAITITAYARNPASGRYVHPEQNRGLSVREAALLQSFPKNYEFYGSLDERFRQIGNAVPPAFAAFLAAHIREQFVINVSESEFNRGITSSVGPSFSRLIPALKAGYRKNTHSN